MLFQSNFIDIVLIIAIITIICIWFYQNESRSRIRDPGQNVFTNVNDSGTDNDVSAVKPGIITNDIEFPQQHNKTRLLTNQRGVNIGFHEEFKKWLPELGWRSFYLRNFNGLNELEKDNKGKTVVNNYLSCLTNTDNVYKYVDY
jgi:hypothetical protein